MATKTHKQRMRELQERIHQLEKEAREETERLEREQDEHEKLMADRLEHAAEARVLLVEDLYNHFKIEEEWEDRTNKRTGNVIYKRGTNTPQRVRADVHEVKRINLLLSLIHI